MTEPLIFSYQGAPVPKGRPRTRVIPARPGRPAFATIYTDENTRRFERAVRQVAALAMRGREPFTGPLSVSMRFRLEPPKSTSKRLRAAMLAGEAPYTGASDLDNYFKAVADSLNGICWLDDRQITRLFATKAVSTTAGIDVRIEPLDQQGSP